MTILKPHVGPALVVVGYHGQNDLLLWKRHLPSRITSGAYVWTDEGVERPRWELAATRHGAKRARSPVSNLHDSHRCRESSMKTHGIEVRALRGLPVGQGALALLLVVAAGWDRSRVRSTRREPDGGGLLGESAAFGR